MAKRRTKPSPEAAKPESEPEPRPDWGAEEIWSGLVDDWLVSHRLEWKEPGADAPERSPGETKEHTELHVYFRAFNEADIEHVRQCELVFVPSKPKPIYQGRGTVVEESESQLVAFASVTPVAFSALIAGLLEDRLDNVSVGLRRAPGHDPAVSYTSMGGLPRLGSLDELRLDEPDE